VDKKKIIHSFIWGLIITLIGVFTAHSLTQKSKSTQFRQAILRQVEQLSNRIAVLESSIDQLKQLTQNLMGFHSGALKRLNQQQKMLTIEMERAASSISILESALGEEVVKLSGSHRDYHISSLKRGEKWKLEFIGFQCRLNIEAEAYPAGNTSTQPYNLGSIMRPVEGYDFLIIGDRLTDPFYNFKRRQWHTPSQDFYDENGHLVDKLDIVIRIYPEIEDVCKGVVNLTQVDPY